MIGNGITDGLWNSYADGKMVEIRLRGNSTMWLPKQPYRIKFPEKFSPLGLNHAKEKSWVLLANDADKTLLRNDVAFKAAKIMKNLVVTVKYPQDDDYDISQEANFKRWNITTQSLPQGGVPPQNYELGVKQLKDYLNARYTYIDGVFNSW